MEPTNQSNNLLSSHSRNGKDVHDDSSHLDFETICAHTGEDRTRFLGAVVPPIFQNSLFTYPSCAARDAGVSGLVSGRSRKPEGNAKEANHTGEWDGTNAEAADIYEYTRVANPTAEVVETKIAALERGERARLFGSGMGAISAAILSCVRAGDHVVTPQTVYGPTRMFLTEYLARFDISVSFVDGCDPQDWANACQPNTRLLFLESPSSYLMKQQDLQAIADIARERGASTICDNSWASPYFQNPIALGIDLCVHSATKYLGGHSDILAGVVVGSEERIHRLTWHESALLGATLDPFAAWLLLRGIRTLPVRMERHQQNARTVAARLHAHPAVARVFYPGTPDDPQPELTRRQLRGTSGLLSLQLTHATKEATYRFIDSLRWFGIGCSWGGFESLALPAAFPASFFDPSASAGEMMWVARLHIGLESVEDIWEDIAAALGGIEK